MKLFVCLKDFEVFEKDVIYYGTKKEDKAIVYSHDNVHFTFSLDEENEYFKEVVLCY